MARGGAAFGGGLVRRARGRRKRHERCSIWRVQDGMNAAQAGDTVSVLPGTYTEAVQTVRGGSAGLPIRLSALGGPGSVILSVRGRVLPSTTRTSPWKA